MMLPPILFIAGIDTDVGKTFATGWFAKRLADNGKRVITQKLVQTGAEGIATDILTHRRLQGIAPLPEDKSKLTCRHVYPYPCSPHLAAKLSGNPINLAQISADTTTLSSQFDIVLLEGAGGLMVPLTTTTTTLDYIAQQGYPLILVTSGKLGSINHTLLSLTTCSMNNIPVYGVIYNSFPQIDSIIEAETQHYLQHYLNKYFPQATYLNMPLLSIN